MDEFKLTEDNMKGWGLHKRADKDVLVYSMGCIDEGHGPALQRDNDCLVAKRTAVQASETLGVQYKGHLPFVSDRVGEIAKDWCPAWQSMDEVLEGIIEFVRYDLSKWRKPVTHVAIVSGHGGNNFLKDEEAKLKEKIGVPVYYVLPFADCETQHENYGKVFVEHANSGEHSVAAYMRLLDVKWLERINQEASRDPEKVLRDYKPLCGLGGYSLLGGERYKILRKYGLHEVAEQFLEEKHILGDAMVGEDLFNQNLENTITQIRDFSGI